RQAEDVEQDLPVRPREDRLPVRADAIDGLGAARRLPLRLPALGVRRPREGLFLVAMDAGQVGSPGASASPDAEPSAFRNGNRFSRVATGEDGSAVAST